MSNLRGLDITSSVPHARLLLIMRNPEPGSALSNRGAMCMRASRPNYAVERFGRVFYFMQRCR